MVEQVNGSKEQEYYMDPNGVPMPRKSLHEHQYSIEQLRDMKQKYLMENVINYGYDATEFAQFMEYKRGKSLYLFALTKEDPSLKERGNKNSSTKNSLLFLS